MALLDFIVALELAIYQHFSRQTRGTDDDIVEALEYLARQLGLIAVIESPASPLARHLSEQTKQYLERTGLATEEAQKGIAIVIDLLKDFSAEADEARRGLHGLLGHLEQNFNLEEALQPTAETIEVPKILTPSQLKAPTSPS